MGITLYVAQIQSNLTSRRNLPLLVAALRKTLKHIGFVSHQPVQAHNIAPRVADALKHVSITLLFFPVFAFGGSSVAFNCKRIIKMHSQDSIVDVINLFFERLNKRLESICDVINQGIRNPVRRNRDIIFELANASPNIGRMWCHRKVELQIQRQQSRWCG